jgi:hypothetical protein
MSSAEPDLPPNNCGEYKAQQHKNDKHQAKAAKEKPAFRVLAAQLSVRNGRGSRPGLTLDLDTYGSPFWGGIKCIEEQVEQDLADLADVGLDL